MHKTSYFKMRRFRDTYLDRQSSLTVLDVGGHGLDFADSDYSDHDGSYMGLFMHPNWQYKTLNPANDPGVDFYVENPFDWKNVPDGYADVVISGQTFEHIDFFWITMLEIRRVLKPGGLICIIAPSGGPEHKYPLDCYRFYADGMVALARSSGFAALEVRTDYVYDGVPPNYILSFDEETEKLLTDAHTGCRFGDSMLVGRKVPLPADTEALLLSLHKKYILLLSALKNDMPCDVPEKQTINRLPPLHGNAWQFLDIRLYIDIGEGFGKTYLEQNVFSRDRTFRLIFDLSGYEQIKALRLDVLSDSVLMARIRKAEAGACILDFMPQNCRCIAGWALLSNDASCFICQNLQSSAATLALEFEIGPKKTAYADDSLMLADGAADG